MKPRIVLDETLLGAMLSQVTEKKGDPTKPKEKTDEEKAKESLLEKKASGLSDAEVAMMYGEGLRIIVPSQRKLAQDNM